jgi:ATP-dependent helicase IRC3
LILAHRQELVAQAYRHCKLAYPEKWIEIEKGKNHASGVADITVASMQSITSQDRIEKFDPSRFKLVLVDEAHHIVAPNYLRILEHFGLRPVKNDSPVLVGVSATMSRFDGLSLGAAIDIIVYHKYVRTSPTVVSMLRQCRGYIEMIDENWLSNVLFTTVAINADLSNVKSTRGGDFETAALSKAVNTPENNEGTYLAWHERASNRKSTLIFCVDVAHIHDLTATFLRHGVEAKFVTGSTNSPDRHKILEGFKQREYPVLLNCGVFTEGTDIPNVDCVILARPTKSRNLLVQMIGRGTRLYKGKENCHIIDMVSSLKTGIVTAPTLFGLDPDELIQEASIEDLKDRKERKEAETKAPKALARTSGNTINMSGTMTFTDYDSVEDLIEDTSGEHHIRSISQCAWVQVDANKYILTNRRGSYVSIAQVDGIDDPNVIKPFHVVYTAKLPFDQTKKSPYARPRTIATAETFSDAIHAADTFAMTTPAFEYSFIMKNQPWRRGPATEAQLKFLNKMRDVDNQLEDADVTKGQAMDMITKMKFGAKGRFSRMAVSKRRVLKEQEGLQKQIERIKGQEVKVGPILK